MSESLQPHGLYSPWNSPGQNTRVGGLSLLQGIFSTQELNPQVSHICRRILYQLSHKGSPRELEWVAYSFSSGSSRTRNGTRVFCIPGGFFTDWDIREAHKSVTIRENNSTLDYIKIKNFVYQKTPLGECKGKLQSGRKHMQCINSWPRICIQNI